MQELKVSLENVEYTKHQLQTALNDANRRLEEEDRVSLRTRADRRVVPGDEVADVMVETLETALYHSCVSVPIHRHMIITGVVLSKRGQKSAKGSASFYPSCVAND